MNFSENPKLYIFQYFDDKINQIDFNCEKAILACEPGINHEILNNTRLNLINKIKSVREGVFERFDFTEITCGMEMWTKNEKEIKDNIFLDKYCYVLNIHEQKRPIMKKFRIGILIFSEIDDDLLKRLRLKFLRLL